jgi:glucans biosynthesis protein C
LYGLAAPLALNEVALRPLFPETHNLVADWYLFNHYLLLTVYGFLLASMPQVWNWFAAQRRLALLAALSVLAVVIPLFMTDVLHSGTVADAISANVFTWLGLMALLGYGRHYLSHSNSLLRWSRDACYPIYILHQTLIVAAGYFVVQLDWHPWFKFAVVVAVTLVGCVLLYEVVVRRWTVTRILFGLKVPSARAQPVQVSQPAG